MAWENLEEDLAEAFGHVVAELALYEDRRNQRTMHVVPKSTPQPRTERRAAVCAAAQKRWVHKNAEQRRWKAFYRLKEARCIFPGCCNLLVPPWVIRPGRFAATCDTAHSRDLAALKRMSRKHAISASGAMGGSTTRATRATLSPSL